MESSDTAHVLVNVVGPGNDDLSLLCSGIELVLGDPLQVTGGGGSAGLAAGTGGSGLRHGDVGLTFDCGGGLAVLAIDGLHAAAQETVCTSM